MKTIKIPEGLHQDLMIIKATYQFKTIGEAIRFLWIYWKENKNDKKTK